MVKKCITYIETCCKETDKIRGLVNLIGWDFNNKDGLFNPEIISTNSKLIIPTKILYQPNDETYNNYIKELKENIIKKYTDKISKLKKDKESIEKKIIFEEFLNNIDNNIKLEKINLNKDYSLYHLITPFIDKSLIKKKIPDSFKIDESSFKFSSELKFNFPFGIIEYKDNNVEILNDKIPLEALLNSKGFGIDIETKNWEYIRKKQELINSEIEKIKDYFYNLLDNFEPKEKIEFIKKEKYMDKEEYIHEIEKILNKYKNEEITIVSLIDLDNKNNYLISTFKDFDNYIDVLIPGTLIKERINILKAKTQTEMISLTNELINKINPLYLFGHNSISFDNFKFKELIDNCLFGVNLTKPVFEAQIAEGTYKRIVWPGRLDCDSSFHSKNYMKNYNNKLDVVFEDICKTKSKKNISSKEQLTLETKLVELGDKGAIRNMEYYASQDGMKPFLISKKILLEYILISRLYSSLPSKINFTSKKTLANDFWNIHMFNKIKTYPYNLNFQKSEIYNYNNNKIENISFNEFNYKTYFYNKISKKSNFNSKKGIYSVNVISIFPLGKILTEFDFNNTTLKEYINHIKNNNDNDSKIRLYRALEPIFEYPYFKVLNNNYQNKDFNKDFCLDFTLKLEDFKNLIDKYERLTIKLFSTFKDSRVLNYNKDTLILEQNNEKEIIEYLEKNNIGFSIGKGTFLSGTSGKFIGYINDTLRMYGFNDFDSNKGNNMKLEKEFYNKFTKLLLHENNLFEALNYLNLTCKKFYNNSLTIEDLSFEFTVKKDIYNYSNLNSVRGKLIKENKSKINDLLKKTYTLDESKEKVLGYSINNKIEPDLFNNHIEFKDGSISELTYWIFNNNFECKKILKNIFLGYGTNEDINKLIELKNII